MKKILIGLLAIVSISAFAANMADNNDPKDKNAKITCYSSGIKIFGPKVVYEVTTLDYGRQGGVVPTTMVYETKEAVNSRKYDAIISNATCVGERL
jgi:hypothetical protein